jgi:hypothetical protein
MYTTTGRRTIARNDAYSLAAIEHVALIFDRNNSSLLSCKNAGMLRVPVNGDQERGGQRSLGRIEHRVVAVASDSVTITRFVPATAIAMKCSLKAGHACDRLIL